MTTKYTCGSNMPGYMPDGEPYNVDTLSDAKECLAEDITHYLEDLNLDSRYSDEQVKEYGATLSEFDKAEPQQCNVYIGDYVFLITEQ